MAFTPSRSALYRIHVNSIVLAREVTLPPKGNEFAGRATLNLYSLLSGGGKTISFADYNPTWKLQRKIAHGALRMFGSGMDRIQDKVFEEVSDLHSIFIRTSKFWAGLNLLKYFEDFSLKCS